MEGRTVNTIPWIAKWTIGLAAVTCLVMVLMLASPILVPIYIVSCVIGHGNRS